MSNLQVKIIFFVLATDVLAVVTTSSDLQHIVSQKTGKEHVKRDIHIVDNSGTTVSNLSTLYVYIYIYITHALHLLL